MENQKLNIEDFPSLFLASDEASLNAQKNHLRLMSTDIILMILSVCLSVYAFSGEQEKIVIAIISSISIGISIILTAIIRIVRYDNTWYDGRAVAESVKTLSWRYMIGAEPYELSEPIDKVDKKFISTLNKILKERKELHSSLGGRYDDKPQLTTVMRQIRQLDLTSRKEIYIEQRINGQRSWYSSKCKLNKDKERNWFIVIIISQILALVSSIIVVRNPDSIINLTGLFITIAASAISWLQLKQHQELAQSYGLASQELGLIIEQSHYINSENELSDFVADSENAISREHTMWLARRDN